MLRRTKNRVVNPRSLRDLYAAILNHDFDETKILFRQLKQKMDSNTKKKIKFLIKVAKIKHSFKI